MKLKQYLLTSFATLLLGAPLAQAAELPTLRVGDQNYYNVRASMEASGVLEGAPYQVEWKHFQSAAPVAEGLQAGALDLGFLGDSGFIFLAAWVLRSQLKQALERLGTAERYVLTCGSSLLARFAVAEVQALSGKPVFLLDGGTNAWVAAGLPTEDGESLLASPRIDRYRRPYEGTDNPREAMQGYLDWEFGLVEQLGRDGTHGFFVI